jgi:hypothetical protein
MTLVGMNEDGSAVQGDFTNTTVIAEIITNRSNIETNKNNINTNKTNIENLEAVYSGSDKLFGENDKEPDGSSKNFPKYFGNVNNILSRWGNLITSNEDIKKYITTTEEDIYKNYYDLAASGALEVKDISSALCLAEGALKAIQNISLQKVIDTANTAQSAALAAAQAVEQKIFNAENTIPETFGKNDNDACYFNQHNSVASAFGLTDNEEACFFNEKNSVKKNIQDLAADIVGLNNTKTDKSTFNVEIQEINKALKAKVDNSTLESYLTTE